MDRSHMTDLNFAMSERGAEFLAEVRNFIEDEVLAVEGEYMAEIGAHGDRWQLSPRMLEILDNLKKKARAKGLWNFFLTGSKAGAGLSTVEYAYLAEEMGRSHLAAEAFNCSAPDTGNMEVLERYGSDAQKEQWLKPLLDGEIRSAFAMSEPDVASSDATNIAMPALLEGGEWLLRGEKHYISGAGDPRCKVLITMVKTDPDAPRHAQHSQILVPTDAQGVEIVRPMHVFGGDSAPHGHMHIRFNDVHVPESNLINERGRGFEIAQGRLGPGRIHHCMRAIGQAERALQLLCERAVSREAFGKPLARLGANYDIIAESRTQIESARLLVLKAAFMIDKLGVRGAQPWISMVKAEAPRVALKVIDEAMQIYGALGLSKDLPLAEMYAHARTLRLADGPDAVHRRQVARAELKPYTNRKV